MRWNGGKVLGMIKLWWWQVMNQKAFQDAVVQQIEESKQTQFILPLYLYAYPVEMNNRWISIVNLEITGLRELQVSKRLLCQM
jgi:hypothetical protein